MSDDPIEEEALEEIELLCWIDIETTGLSVEQDIPLEVGIILTDFQFNEVARESWLCTVQNFDWEPSNPYVREMHTGNGLLQAMHERGVSFRSYAELDEKIVDWLWSVINITDSDVTLYPSGSSVHFDVAFIKKRFPSFYSMLYHRHYDVSSIKMFFQSVMGFYDKGPEDPHRAIGDLENDIAWVRERAEEMAYVVTKGVLDGERDGG